MNIFKTTESEVRSYCRSFPVVFERSEGDWLYDDQGNAYLDFLSGAGTLNYGNNNPHLKSALLQYIEKDGVTHGLDMHTSAKAYFLHAMRRFIFEPRGLNYKVQFTGPT